MCAVELRCLVDFAGAARWRSEKADEFPADRRNKVAESLLLSLADGAEKFEGGVIHERIALLFEGNSDAEDACGDLLRSVGFSWFPASAEDALNAVADHLGV